MVSKDNNGFSLIELIVVIAVMGIFLGVGLYTINYLFGGDAKQLTNKLDGELNEVKTGSMSRFDETLTIEYCTSAEGKQYDSEGYYAVKELWTIRNNMANPSTSIRKSIGEESTRMGSGRSVIKVQFEDGAIVTLGAEGNSGENTLMITFDRATGALNDAYIIPKGGDISSATKTGNLSTITITGGRKEYVVTFDVSTGRHTLSNS
ncbi:MAG: prepilin-type N-terminal cleavage/methylation domain-containing protein [Lachnospiraceae bacterium]|nr:prepilin-type N-terminal cleavage/methylation domain-containing protein [Lachnospiraceae bacterium]